MEQKIEPFNADDLARVEAQRKWIREHHEPDSEHKYDTLTACRGQTAVHFNAKGQNPLLQTDDTQLTKET
ncbi:MAG: hypothetical protein PVJ86_05975 [Phycisphaerales bacterium]|jgi:hypothetical protein